MFTPKELQEKTFDKAVFGGYDMQAVDEFLEPLTQDYITLYKENSVLKSKMKILVEKLEEYREQELSMKKALVAAQQTSESIVAEAQKKAAGILNDAEAAALGKASDLKQDFAAEQQRVERARAAAQDYIEALEREIRQHLDRLETLKHLTRPPESASQKAPEAASQKAPEAQAAPENTPEAPPAAQSAAPESPDLIAQIGNAVQQIAAEESGEVFAEDKAGKSGFRFEDLQFGKDYSFTK